MKEILACKTLVALEMHTWFWKETPPLGWKCRRGGS